MDSFCRVRSWWTKPGPHSRCPRPRGYFRALLRAKTGHGTRGAGHAEAREIGNARCNFDPQIDTSLKEPRATVLIPGARVRYLAEIAEQGRAVNRGIEAQAEAAARAESFYRVLGDMGDALRPEPLHLYPNDALQESAPRKAEMEAVRADRSSYLIDGDELERNASERAIRVLRQRYNDAVRALSSESIQLLQDWPARLKSIVDPTTEYKVRDKTIRVENYRESLSHQQIPKIAAPTFNDWASLLRFLCKENLPGAYPYTGGVFPYRRTGEDPTRMFAGEGTPERTNRRFHYLSLGQPAARLSTDRKSTRLNSSH